MSTYKGFTKVKMRKPERSKFDLSHEKKLSTRMGKLVPIFISETLPNDTFRVNSEVMLRLAPLLAPIYHRVNVFVHYFFVPMRLLWDQWEPFITNGRLGTEAPPEVPYFGLRDLLNVDQDLLDVGSLADYLGVATIKDADVGNWSALTAQVLSPWPFAAYYKCWYDYFRDRNYIDDNDMLPLSLSKNEGSANFAGGNFLDIVKLKTRDWQKEYFTSALPWTQRGDQVLMPLAGYGTAESSTIDYLEASLVKTTAGTAVSQTGDLYATEDAFELGIPAITPGAIGRIENIDKITSDVEMTGSSVSINDLRQAVRLQEWLERNAVAGSRYNESIMAHFNRRTSDGRLQRAEYLGGGRQNVQINEVMTTAWSEDADANSVPPANMSGRGIAYAKSNRFTYNCEEHGFVIGIMSVMPKAAYMNTTSRMFTHRNTFLDYPWPSFGHLGEQPVFKNEIFASPANWPVLNDADNAPIFGYQSRYADWKWLPSTAHGDFKSTLDFWHLDRKFEASPSLGETFVKFEDTLQDRIFAVAEVDTLWCYIYNSCTVVRSLPYYGTPLL